VGSVLGPRSAGSTPDSVLAVICLRILQRVPWQLLACEVLPRFTVAAAVRPSYSPAHSPCSQLHARPAGHIAVTAGGLLPHRFTPHPHLAGPMMVTAGPLAGLLSVAVVVTRRLPSGCPHLLFRGATLPTLPDGPGVGKFLYPALGAE
jgi:hypothetical protein